MQDTLKYKSTLDLSDKEAYDIQVANAEFIAYARQDIPILLDALKVKKICADEEFAGNRMKGAFEKRIAGLMTENDRLQSPSEISGLGISDDRDRWKAKAEALERALKESGLQEDCMSLCFTCVHHDPWVSPLA